MKPTAGITVVIPVHDGSRYLAAAIESVLAQKISVHQLIVVDDGSTDDSLRVAAGYDDRVTCLSLPHRGPAAARNAGVEQATGHWLAFLDADDLWLPNRLACQLPVAAADPTAAVTGGWENFLSPDCDPAAGPTSRFPTGPQTAPMACSLLIARTRFLEIGLFDESLRAGEFIDWVLRARQAGLRFTEVPQVVYRRRIHATNHSRHQTTRNEGYLRLIRKHRGDASSPPASPTP